MCVSLDNFVTEEEQGEQELGLHFPEREKKTCYVLLCQVKLSDILEFLPLQLGFPKMCGKSTECAAPWDIFHPKHWGGQCT